MPSFDDVLCLILGLGLGALTATGGCLWFIQREYKRPIGDLSELIDKIAQGKTPPRFNLSGPDWLKSLLGNLEEIFSRMERLGKVRRDEDLNLNVLLENMVEGVMVVDRNHVIQLVNRELMTLFSVTDSPVQRTVLEALRQAVVEMVLREAISTGKPVRREVVLVKYATDRSGDKCFEMSAVPIRSANGPIGGAVAVFHDITRVKQLESVRQEFVANISHELRTPLSIFRGYLENLIEGPKIDKEQTARILEAMRRHSNRLNALVEDLLTLTRLDSKKLELKWTSIRFEAFVRQLIEDWQQRFSGSQAQLTIDIPSDLPCMELDTVQFGQLLFNLLDNAVAYSNPPREITIRATRVDGEMLEITIADNGVGIPEADLPHIFERFYRVDRGRSRNSGGTGLGLSIVKHIVTGHGGNVEVLSTLGKGTTVKLHFPFEQVEDRELQVSVQG